MQVTRIYRYDLQLSGSEFDALKHMLSNMSKTDMETFISYKEKSASSVLMKLYHDMIEIKEAAGV